MKNDINFSKYIDKNRKPWYSVKVVTDVTLLGD